MAAAFRTATFFLAVGLLLLLLCWLSPLDSVVPMVIGGVLLGAGALGVIVVQALQETQARDRRSNDLASH